MSFVNKYMKYKSKLVNSQTGGAEEGDTICDMQGNILGVISVKDTVNNEIIYMNVLTGEIGQKLINEENSTWKVFTPPHQPPGNVQVNIGAKEGDTICDMQGNILGIISVIDLRDNEIIYINNVTGEIGQKLISELNKTWKVHLPPPPPIGFIPQQPPPGLEEKPKRKVIGLKFPFIHGEIVEEKADSYIIKYYYLGREKIRIIKKDDQGNTWMFE